MDLQLFKKRNKLLVIITAENLFKINIFTMLIRKFSTYSLFRLNVNACAHYLYKVKKVETINNE